MTENYSQKYFLLDSYECSGFDITLMSQRSYRLSIDKVIFMF